MSAGVPADGAIDYWCNRFFPEQADVWNAALEATGIAVKVRTDDADSFCDADTMVARMDELGIAAVILPVAPSARPPRGHRLRAGCGPAW